MELVFKKNIPLYISKQFPVLFGGIFRLDTTTEFAYILYTEDKYPIGCVYGEILSCGFNEKTGELKHDIMIHKFEIEKVLRGNGYGRTMYNMLVDKLNPSEIVLNYLDDDALKFWKRLGFRKNKDSDELYHKFK
jgi:GNAT superfamily N-acetyltransferase